MSSNNESIGKTLTVVVALCLVCAIIVSFASVQLRPLQQANKTQDIQRNILAVQALKYQVLCQIPLTQKLKLVL